jgi:hypothetical protein
MKTKKEFLEAVMYFLLNSVDNIMKCDYNYGHGYSL